MIFGKETLKRVNFIFFLNQINLSKNIKVKELLVNTYSADKKKQHKKVILGSKNMLYIIFFFRCLKMIICELMLLELGDLLWSSLLRNFLVRQGQYFLVNISSVLVSISGGLETIKNHHDIAKLSVAGWF